MKTRKRIGYRRPKSPLADILLAPFFALIYSIPAAIISIPLFFIFGLICGAIEPLGELMDKIFTSLPFWNEKWEYAWVLYFAIAIGIIFEIIFTIRNIYWSFSGYETIPTKADQKNEEARSYQYRWDNMSIDEQKAELLRDNPEIYNEIWHGVPRTSHITEYQEKLKKEKEQLSKEQWSRDYDLKMQRQRIIEELEKLNRSR